MIFADSAKQLDPWMTRPGIEKWSSPFTVIIVANTMASSREAWRHLRTSMPAASDMVYTRTTSRSIETFFAGSLMDGNSEGHTLRRTAAQKKEKTVWHRTKATGKGKRSGCTKYLLKLMSPADVAMTADPSRTTGPEL